MTARSGYLPEAEGLRGIAILLVFLFHADGLIDIPHSSGTWVSPFAAFVHAGYTGVSLFFVLSAFFLSRPFIAAAYGAQPPSVRRYFTRRALRILPMYWLVVVVSALLSASRPAEVGRAVPWMLFLNSFPRKSTPLPPYSIPWWSLATEVQFYLVLPVVGVLLRSRTGRIVLFVAAMGYLTAYLTSLAGVWWGGTIEGTLRMWSSVLGRGPVFIAGIIAAWIYERWGMMLAAQARGSRWVARGAADVALILLLGGLGFLLRAVVRAGLPVAEVGLWNTWHAAEGAIWATMLLLLLLVPLRSRPIWSNPWLGRVGLVSYSLFLVHLPIVHWVFEPYRKVRPFGIFWSDPRVVLLVLVTLLVSLGLSTVTYRFVERPFLARKPAHAGA